MRRSLKCMVTFEAKGSCKALNKFSVFRIKCIEFYSALKMQSIVFVIVLLLGLTVAIEVYETPNENATDSEPMLKSTLPNSSVQNGSAISLQPAISEPGKSIAPVTTSSVNYNSIDDQQQPLNNHHHQHKHSSSYRDTPLSITPTTVSPSPSVPTVVPASTVSSLSSSSASLASSSGSSFKEYVTRCDRQVLTLFGFWVGGLHSKNIHRYASLEFK